MALPAMLSVAEDDGVVSVCVTLDSDADTERDVGVTLTTANDTGMEYNTVFTLLAAMYCFMQHWTVLTTLASTWLLSPLMLIPAMVHYSAWISQSSTTLHWS